MANIRDLKKDINFVLGDIIEAVYVWEYTNTDKDTKKSEAIIDEAIETFDGLIARVNDKSTENKKAHFKAINSDLETQGRVLIEKLNKLT
ncbi:MAG: putative transcriptional regulator [Psychroserpens sp.]|jgi:predicted transcriptional regulator